MSNKKNKKDETLVEIAFGIAVIIFALIIGKTNILAVLIVAAIAIAGFLVIKFKIEQKETEKTETNVSLHHEDDVNSVKYVAKQSLLTKAEKNLYNKLSNIIGDEYIMQAQVSLGALVEKVSTSKFRNELFRIVDFCVFDKEWKPLVVVELNDESHKQKERRERDMKVKAILQEAGIPILTLYTAYPNEEVYVRKRLSEHIPSLSAKVEQQKEEKATV